MSKIERPTVLPKLSSVESQYVDITRVHVASWRDSRGGSEGSPARPCSGHNEFWPNSVYPRNPTQHPTGGSDRPGPPCHLRGHSQGVKAAELALVHTDVLLEEAAVLIHMEAELHLEACTEARE
ncbi:hypothetical protein DPEC_G00285320 [Dallia pectoralis]|uniref:Uncharacterized protein n=1 Tax=Dallia pectoralis TaxID=75939 RepID=A0ACC2FJW0_DALPE|nr:hypothetical protein DPEC_G00285320 [Dallia pectoralis]